MFEKFILVDIVVLIQEFFIYLEYLNIQTDKLSIITIIITYIMVIYRCCVISKYSFQVKKSFWNIHNDLSLIALGTLGTLGTAVYFRKEDDFGPNKGKIAPSYFY